MQFEPFSDFLHYYRIIESVDRGNGKEWIRANLDRIENFDFGFLELGDDGYLGNPTRDGE